MICLVWWLHRRARAGAAPQPAFPAYRWPVEVLAVLLVTVTGHLGSFLSGVNGPG
jgi:hypothetical protein